MPMIVMRENQRGETRSHALKSKHVDVSQCSYMIRSMVSNIDTMGYKRVILKSDQEPVMRALQVQLKKRLGIEVIPRFSPVGQSAANGVVEKAIHEVEAQLRTMIFAVEHRLNFRMEPESPIMYWMVEYASELINRCKVQPRDNQTSYPRKFGKKDVLALAEFCEAVHYMPMGANQFENNSRRLQKAEPRLQVGVFLGLEKNSNEYRIGIEHGTVVKYVTLKRLPPSSQKHTYER